MRDLYDTRLDHPPERLYRVAVCPECGCEELGEMINVISYRRILSWDDGKPWDSEEEESIDQEYLDPRYYCCNCGDEFGEPDFVEEYG